MKHFSRPSYSPWLTRWTVVFFAGSTAVAASCGSNRGGDSSPPTRGGQSNNGGTSGGSAPTASGGTLNGDGGNPETAGQPDGTSGEAGAPGSSAGGPGEIPDAGRTYPDVSFTYDAGSSDGAVTPEDTCASGAIETLPIPLDMYVVLDRSGSMNLPQPLPVGNTTPGGGDCNVGDATISRWCYSINALDRFFGASVATGTGLALQFFPAGGCTTSPSPLLYGCCDTGACCNGALEAKPEVVGTLPDARAELAAALDAATPWADRTPIEAALHGMIAYTGKNARPGRQMMGLLITDGGPEGCNNSSASLAAMVSAHRAATQIPIYVVGTQGAAYSWLEPVAVAGGAPAHTQHCAGGVRPCHFYDVGSANPDVFIEVLQQIQRAAIACTFAMPTGDAGLIDPKEVAVSLTPASGGSAKRVNHVASLDACASGGFYYDDNATPSVISLCPSSCDALRAGDGGKVELLLGCKGS